MPKVRIILGAILPEVDQATCAVAGLRLGVRVIVRVSHSVLLYLLRQRTLSLVSASRKVSEIVLSDISPAWFPCMVLGWG